jgi:type IV pilus assembly protein PilC
MAQYDCKVADSTGRVFHQMEAAQSEEEARQRLVDKGLFVYSVRSRAIVLPAAFSERRAGKLRPTDFLVFNQQFNTLIKAGLPILKALDLLAERAAAPRLRPLLAEVRDRVREGAALSQALEEQAIFPRVYTTSILAGEKSGNLSGVLDSYIAYQRVTTGFRKALIAALVYPMILIVVALFILIYIVGYVIPEFNRLYTELNVVLPPVTYVLVDLTTRFRPHMLIGAGLAVLGGFGLWGWSKSASGGAQLDRFKLRFPLLGEIWQKFQMAQLMRTLATLLTGGTPLVTALDTSAGAASSRLIAASVRDAAQRVREGQSLHSSLRESGVVPELATEMIEVGEATGALAPMLVSVAEFYEEDVKLQLSALVGLVQPLILVVMGSVVAFILISLYLPIFSFSVAGAVR